MDSSQNLDAPARSGVASSMIDDSQAGGYSAIATQFQVDHYLNFAQVKAWVDGTLGLRRAAHADLDRAAVAGIHRGAGGDAITNYSWNAGHRFAVAFSLTVPAGCRAADGDGAGRPSPGKVPEQRPRSTGRRWYPRR